MFCLLLLKTWQKNDRFHTSLLSLHTSCLPHHEISAEGKVSWLLLMNFTVKKFFIFSYFIWIQNEKTLILIATDPSRSFHPASHSRYCLTYAHKAVNFQFFATEYSCSVNHKVPRAEKIIFSQDETENDHLRKFLLPKTIFLWEAE